MKLPFTKMHGAGNDFIVIDGVRDKIPLSEKTIQKLCDRHFGIGADQLLLLKKSGKADFRMEIFNADGSRAEMCGNGIRCVAHYVREMGYSRKEELCLETLAGVQTIVAVSKDRYRVNMGAPILVGEKIPVKLKGRIINHTLRIEGKEYRMTCVSMGNPHAVLFVDSMEGAPVASLGPLVENYYLFPKKTNVGFVRVVDRKKISLRVWERGTGETLACGSGACAAAVAGHLNGLTDREVEVKLPGGTLQIEWNKGDGHVYMTGPAETVFEGEVEI